MFFFQMTYIQSVCIIPNFPILIIRSARMITIELSDLRHLNIVSQKGSCFKTVQPNFISFGMYLHFGFWQEFLKRPSSPRLFISFREMLTWPLSELKTDVQLNGDIPRSKNAIWNWNFYFNWSRLLWHGTAGQKSCCLNFFQIYPSAYMKTASWQISVGIYERSGIKNAKSQQNTNRWDSCRKYPFEQLLSAPKD